jgi:hypothetical protein
MPQRGPRLSQADSGARSRPPLTRASQRQAALPARMLGRSTP